MNDPIDNRIEGTPRPSLTAASALVLLATAGLWLSALGAGLIRAEAGALFAIENALYYLPFVALPLAVYARRRPGLGAALRLNPLPMLSVVTLILVGLVSVYLASPLAAVWGALLDGLGLKGVGSLPAAQSEGELALSIIVMAALPAVCEELLFRGAVLSAWETRGTALAIGVSSALFALIHGNLYGLPAFLLVGAVAGFVTWATNSVYAGMVYHTVYNTACLVIPYLMAGQGDGAGFAFTAERVFALVLQTLMFAGLMGLGLTSLWLRARNEDVVSFPRSKAAPLSAGERLWLAAAVLATVATTAIVLALSGGGAA